MSAPPFDDVVGPQNVTEATPKDAVDGVRPQWVVRPGSAEEAAAVVRRARDRDLVLIPRGRGRHLDLGNPPLRVDAILSTERLDRVVDYEPADMTVRVQAGCSVADLGGVLHQSGQWLPLDPPEASETTIGGLLSANLSGPLRSSQGTARDLLIGIRIVAPDGTIVSGGGRVVKNVAGYDLPKMYIGALGSLGFLVDATFKVRPRPAREEAIAVSCESAERALEIALAMRDASEPFWLQIVSEAGGMEPWEVVAGSAGRAEEVAAAGERHQSAARHLGGSARRVEHATERRHRIAGIATSHAHPVIRASMLPTRVGSFLTSLRAAVVRRGGAVSLQADVPSGVARASIEGALDLVDVVAEMRPPIERDGGALVVERASVADKRRLEPLGGVWGDVGPGLPLMRGLKSAYDPDRRFAPGRFVGGL